MKNRAAALTLILSLFVLLFASCGETGNSDLNENPTSEQSTSAQNTDDATGETTTEEEKLDPIALLAGFPDDGFGGYEFKIWTSNGIYSDLEIRQAPEEQETGDPINDALYRRDRLIEEKFDIEIVYTINNDNNDMLSKARNSLTAGDCVFDYICGDMMIVTKGLAQRGLIVDFNTVPNVNLDNPWWSKNAKRDLTIGNKFFFATGEITPRYLLSPYMMLFNKDMFTDYALEYPYQKVLDGKWTVDALIAYCKDMTRDLDNDEQYTELDQYGFAAEGLTPYAFLLGSGEGLVKINADGMPELNLASEKILGYTEKLASFMHDPQYVYHTPDLSVPYVEVPIFKNDRALFVAQTATNLDMFRDMESDFGIIPVPKYDELQSDYYSFCQAWGAVSVAVPKLADNLARTGTIMEASAALGKAIVTPASYDITLKLKNTRDNDSEEMLNIIYANTCYDFAFIYDWGTLYSAYRSAIYDNASVVSKFESLQSRAQTAMEKTIAEYLENN